MDKRYLIALLGFGMTIASGYCKLPKSLLPTEKEKIAFLNEADDFIDEIPEGTQDKQCDAVLHAMRGHTGELSNIRMSRNSMPELSSAVSRTDLSGDGSARGINMRLYSPAGKDATPLPLLIYFHGGGWTFGSINSCARFCDSLAASGKVIVLAVDYSLAPEKAYPSGLLDCISAIEYAFSHASEWGVDPAMISLGGDSAGGNLALASALYLQESPLSSGAIKSLVLFYPVLKAYADGSRSWKEYSRGYGLDSRLMEAFNEAYLSTPPTGTVVSPATTGASDKENPLISPAHANDSQLKNLPPILLINGERDILCDQGKIFTERLEKIGHDTERIEFPGSVHLFITVDGQPSAFSKAVALTEAFLH